MHRPHFGHPILSAARERICPISLTEPIPFAVRERIGTISLTKPTPFAVRERLGPISLTEPTPVAVRERHSAKMLTNKEKLLQIFGLSKKVRIFAVPFDARMAELVDALLSGGSVRKDVSVRL